MLLKKFFSEAPSGSSEASSPVLNDEWISNGAFDRPLKAPCSTTGRLMS